MEALQFCKCVLRKDLLFREQISTVEEFTLEEDNLLEGLAAEADRLELSGSDSEWIPIDDKSNEWEDVAV